MIGSGNGCRVHAHVHGARRDEQQIGAVEYFCSDARHDHVMPRISEIIFGGPRSVESTNIVHVVDLGAETKQRR